MYQLSVSGPADPTGCGEGFFYSRLTTKVNASTNNFIEHVQVAMVTA